MLIDNGTHLLLSGNHAALSYVEPIGSSAGLHGPKEAEFPFIDLANGEQWTLRFGESRFPWWVFDKDRRVPQTGLPIICRSRDLPGQKPTSRLPKSELLRSALYAFSRAVAACRAQHRAARKGRQSLPASSSGRPSRSGGQACRPLLARDGWDRFSWSLRFPGCASTASPLRSKTSSLRCSCPTAAHRNFNSPGIASISAPTTPSSWPFRLMSQPSWCPGLRANRVPRHRKCAFPCRSAGDASADTRCHQRHRPMDIFACPDGCAVTISDARSTVRHAARGARAEASGTTLRSCMTGFRPMLPPWQIVRERRATFAATPEQNANAPGRENAWSNLFLPATGRPPACRRRSRAPSAPAIAPPSLSAAGCEAAA